MKLVICEKPSQGRDIAKVLGANGRKENYLEGNGYQVTWCVGHLLEQAKPESYANVKPWSVSKLPVIPDAWKMEVKPKVKGQYKTISQLLKNTNDVIIATDADREGEVIAREILEKEKYSGNIERLWLSALDDKSIRQALSKLKAGNETENLYYAGLGRQRADWLIGMNMTMAATSLYSSSGVLSVGRVQTPTLRLVVDRDRVIEDFKPKDFYQVLAEFSNGNGFTTKWQVPESAQGDDEGRCLDRSIAESVVNKISGKQGKVEGYAEKKGKKKQPLPYSLSALQKKASALYGMSAKKVLEVAQSLYEKHKATTYPRTDCGYLPESQLDEAKDVLNAVKSIDGDVSSLVDGADLSIKSYVWNDKKITAHHGIIPTTNSNVSINSMTSDEQKLYDLIRRNYIAQFYPEAEFMSVKVKVSCEGEEFTASGKRPLKDGWLVVFSSGQTDKEVQSDDDFGSIPKLSEGDVVDMAKAQVKDSKTTPPAHFTEGSLIEAMENVGKFITDPELKKILKETSGIGTQATRASIIETLFFREYLSKKGKKVISTDKGRALIDKLPSVLSDPATTARWEQMLEEVATGECELSDFTASQESVLKDMIDTVSKARSEDGADSALSGESEYKCPKCGGALIKRKGKKGNFWGCSSYPECDYTTQDYRGKPKLQKPVEQPENAPKCPDCGSDMKLRSGKNGKFWGCSDFPTCKGILPYDDPNVEKHSCPDCGSALRRIKGNKGYFWGCSGYQQGCKFTAFDNKGKPKLSA